MVISTLRSRQLGFGLRPLQAQRLRFGLRFGDLRLHFRRLEGHEHLALFDRASSIHRHALDEARELGVNRNRQIWLKLAGQLDLPVHSFRRHPDHFHGRRSGRRSW